MFGCGDRKYNCHPTKAHPNLDTPADPDIAGKGVLVAFAATSIISFLAILLAYLGDVFPARKAFDSKERNDEPDGLLNDFDQAFIRRFSPFRRILVKRSEVSKERQYEAFQRFILTLSDQQIVTGLAMLIIAFYKHCTIFTYHFFIIVALGWFSSTTHLSTLTVLHNYFKGSPVLKYTRLSGMIAAFILLFVGLIVIYTNFPFSVPVQCRLEHMSIPSSNAQQILNYICMLLVLIYISLLYLSRTLKFCFDRRKPYSSIHGILFFFLRRSQGEHLSRKEYYQQSLDHASPKYSLKTNFLKFAFVYSEFIDSLLGEIVLLFFNNLYGIRQLMWARTYVAGGIKQSGNVNEWGFGQLLALFLLVLPVLAAAEAYRDTRYKKRERSIELTPSYQSLGTHDPPIPSSTARLINSSDPSDLDPAPAISNGQFTSSNTAQSQPPQALHADDPYKSSQLWVIFSILAAFTLAAATVCAWYLAWAIRPDKYPGIEAGLAMAGILLIAAAAPLYFNYQRIRHS